MVHGRYRSCMVHGRRFRRCMVHGRQLLSSAEDGRTEVYRMVLCPYRHGVRFYTYLTVLYPYEDGADISTICPRTRTVPTFLSGVPVRGQCLHSCQLSTLRDSADKSNSCIRCRTDARTVLMRGQCEHFRQVCSF